MKTEVAKEKEIMIQQAGADAQKILDEGRKALQDEKHHMIEEVEKEIAKLVVLATEKVLSGVTNPKLNEEIVISSIRESEK